MNRICSMTGFAVLKNPHNNGEISCELRSLNSRYLEIFMKLPMGLKDAEDTLKTILRKRLNRGKINCLITLNTEDLDNQNLQVNSNAVQVLKKLLDQIRTESGIQTPITLTDIMQFKEVFAVTETQNTDETLVQCLSDLLNNTVDKLIESRSSEGNNLAIDLQERLENIQNLNMEIKTLGQGNARAEFEKLYSRLQSLIDESQIDRDRLELELAIISDRVDIAEEVVRLDSHINLFRDTITQGSPIGKKLNFILQEMHREANTISAKNTLIEISHRIVTVKDEIERMREQVQNIE